MNVVQLRVFRGRFRFFKGCDISLCLPNAQLGLIGFITGCIDIVTFCYPSAHNGVLFYVYVTYSFFVTNGTSQEYMCKKACARMLNHCQCVHNKHDFKILRFFISNTILYNSKRKEGMTLLQIICVVINISMLTCF